MTEEPVVYQDVFESLLKYGIGKRMSPTLREKLRALDADPEQLRATYRKEQWDGIIEAVRSGLYPTLSRDEGLRRLGEDLVIGTGQTVIGKTLHSIARMLGPKRTLERTPQSYRTGTNFTEVKLTEKGPGEFEMWMNETGTTAMFVVGSLEGTLRIAGAKNPKVEVVRTDFPASTFRITWTP